MHVNLIFVVLLATLAVVAAGDQQRPDSLGVRLQHWLELVHRVRGEPSSSAPLDDVTRDAVDPALLPIESPTGSWPEWLAANAATFGAAAPLSVDEAARVLASLCQTHVGLAGAPWCESVAAAASPVAEPQRADAQAGVQWGVLGDEVLASDVVAQSGGEATLSAGDLYRVPLYFARRRQIPPKDLEDAAAVLCVAGRVVGDGAASSVASAERAFPRLPTVAVVDSAAETSDAARFASLAVVLSVFGSRLYALMGAGSTARPMCAGCAAFRLRELCLPAIEAMLPQPTAAPSFVVVARADLYFLRAVTLRLTNGGLRVETTDPRARYSIVAEEHRGQRYAFAVRNNATLLHDGELLVDAAGTSVFARDRVGDAVLAGSWRVMRAVLQLPSQATTSRAADADDSAPTVPSALLARFLATSAANVTRVTAFDFAADADGVADNDDGDDGGEAPRPLPGFLCRRFAFRTLERGLRSGTSETDAAQRGELGRLQLVGADAAACDAALDRGGAVPMCAPYHVRKLRFAPYGGSPDPLTPCPYCSVVPVTLRAGICAYGGPRERRLSRVYASFSNDGAVRGASGAVDTFSPVDRTLKGDRLSTLGPGPVYNPDERDQDRPRAMPVLLAVHLKKPPVIRKRVNAR